MKPCPPLTQIQKLQVSSLNRLPDLNLRALEPAIPESEHKSTQAQKGQETVFNKKPLAVADWFLWDHSQYLVGTCCWPSFSRAPASYDTIRTGVVSESALVFAFIWEV